MQADLLTKPLPEPIFTQLRHLINIVEKPIQTSKNIKGSVEYSNALVAYMDVYSKLDDNIIFGNIREQLVNSCSAYSPLPLLSALVPQRVVSLRLTN